MNNDPEASAIGKFAAADRLRTEAEKGGGSLLNYFDTRAAASQLDRRATSLLSESGRKRKAGGRMARAQELAKSKRDGQ